MINYAKLILFSLLLLVCNASFSQRTKGFDMDVSLLFTDLIDPFSYGYSGKYNLWLNPYFGFSLGGRVTYSQLEARFDSPNDPSVTYSMKDNDVLTLNGDLGIKSVTPTFKGVGAFADLSFLFAPIPFNVVSVEKRASDASEKIKNKIVYTHFSPSYSLKFGLLYKLKRGGQVGVGGEVSSFNPYNAYSRASIDAVRLKDHVRLVPDKPTYAVFLRVSGLMAK